MGRGGRWGESMLYRKGSYGHMCNELHHYHDPETVQGSTNSWTSARNLGEGSSPLSCFQTSPDLQSIRYSFKQC